jgi:hypothetical protein
MFLHCNSIPGIMMLECDIIQVFDALSFYLDNQEEINHYIEQNRIPEELLKPQRARTLALQRFKDLKI